MVDGARKNQFIEELKTDVNDKEPRVLEVYRDGERIYIAKFDCELYTGRTSRDDEELVEVSQEIVNKICEVFNLTPVYYSLKTREREDCIEYYRKEIEKVFNKRYKSKIKIESIEMERD